MSFCASEMADGLSLAGGFGLGGKMDGKNVLYMMGS